MKINRKIECLENLRARILTMAIAPGADLDEAALSDHYGLSRTPLREVLQRLSGEGYVQLTNNRGAKVASMDLVVMGTFFRTAQLVYSSVARLAAENRTENQLTELRKIQVEFSSAVAASRADEMALANHRFHEKIGEMAANEYLMPSLKRLLIDHTRLGQMFYRPTSSDEVLAVKQACHQHDAMIDAIENGDTEQIVNLTQEHWDLSRNRIERFVRPDPLPIDLGELVENEYAV